MEKVKVQETVSEPSSGQVGIILIVVKLFL